jgi:hypothetical protein
MNGHKHDRDQGEHDGDDAIERLRPGRIAQPAPSKPPAGRLTMILNPAGGDRAEPDGDRLKWQGRGNDDQAHGFVENNRL